jgi:predicted ABC-type sugar transport system permease subunit
VSTTSYAPKAGGASPVAAWQALGRLQGRIPLVQLIALAAVFAYGAATLPGLASWESIKGILVFASLVGLASTGQTLLILMGGFDLSISGFIVASALTVTTLKAKWGLPFGVALLIAVVVAGVMGSRSARSRLGSCSRRPEDCSRAARRPGWRAWPRPGPTRSASTCRRWSRSGRWSRS